MCDQEPGGSKPRDPSTNGTHLDRDRRELNEMDRGMNSMGSSYCPSSDSLSDCDMDVVQVGEVDNGWIGSARSAGRKVWTRFSGGEAVKEKQTFRNRLLSAWNNMKYSGKLMVDHSSQYGGDYQIVLLGKNYYPEKIDPINAFDQFFLDYYSRIWLTYRSGFEEFPGTKVTSDCGWGCMLRSSQMMVAQAILVNRLGREWRWRRRKQSIINDSEVETCGGQLPILELFQDRKGASLGIHRLLEIASEVYTGDVVGKWFSPSEALGLLSRAIRTSSSPLTADLTTVVCVDSRVIIPVIERETRHWTRTLLLFVCVRLGTHSVNKVYYPHLRSLLSLENSLGIAGGKPNHSLNFIGFHDQQLIYLDPHVSHPYIPLEDEFNDMTTVEERHKGKKPRTPLSSYHCKLLSKIHISEIDPSCSIGLIIRNREEFDATMKTLNLNQVIDIELGPEHGSKRTRNPLFTVLHQEPVVYEDTETTHAERVQAEEHGFELL